PRDHEGAGGRGRLRHRGGPASGVHRRAGRRGRRGHEESRHRDAGEVDLLRAQDPVGHHPVQARVQGVRGTTRRSVTKERKDRKMENEKAARSGGFFIGVLWRPFLFCHSGIRSTIFPLCAPASMRAKAFSTSARSKTESTGGRRSWRATKASMSAKSRGEPIAVPRIESCLKKALRMGTCPAPKVAPRNTRRPPGRSASQAPLPTAPPAP